MSREQTGDLPIIEITRHRYTKSYGDGSPRGFCRCGEEKDSIVHDDDLEEFKGENVWE